jgi:ectoine hydroxylase-related dioxygenase (phytanoyl-CoA dioxygenase family)
MVLFTEEVYHAAFGGRTGRPRLALNFEAAASNDERVGVIRPEYEKTKWMYRPARSLVESDRPRLRGMVQPLLELGFDTLDA